MIRHQPKKIDWWQVVTDICRLGHTHASIAICIGVGRATINDWKNNGARPKYEEGEGLIGLWCSLTGNSRESVPRLR